MSTELVAVWRDEPKRWHEMVVTIFRESLRIRTDNVVVFGEASIFHFSMLARVVPAGHKLPAPLPNNYAKGKDVKQSTKGSTHRVAQERQGRPDLPRGRDHRSGLEHGHVIRDD